LNIKEFAAKYHVRTKRDSCGEDIVAGSVRPKDMPARVEYAAHVYDHGDGKRFGLLLLFQSKPKWTYAKKKLVAAGFTIKQDGDTEGTALFDPENCAQVDVAFRVAHIRVRKELTAERREALSARLTAARQSKGASNLGPTPVNKATFGARNDANGTDEAQAQP
jgi:hypothetical protein